jgi:hypothetical protein
LGTELPVHEPFGNKLYLHYGKDIVSKNARKHESPYSESSSMINIKRSIPRHIIDKLSKAKEKEKFLKAAGKNDSSHTRKTVRLTAYFLSEIMEARSQWADSIKVLKEK